jgi:dienelactone hydrolase
MAKRRLPLIAAAAALALVAVVALVLVLVLRSNGDSVEARVRIEPADALLDAPLRLEVDGADDGTPVRLTLSATSADGVLWSGSRTVQADEDGRISVDGGALVTALHPTGVPDSAKLGLYPANGSLELRLRAREGDRALGAALATREMAGPDVAARELTVARDGLAARYWTGPPRDRRPVAVLAVGGSEGGYGNPPQAALLASHGYPVLQLAYFRAPGLPEELRAIPLEYLERALEWLHARPGVKGVVMIGASRGGELALLVGSTYPALVQGVAAYVPFDAVVPGSWTRGGKSIPPAPNPDPRLPVERIRGPVVLVGAGQDQVWNSGYGATAVRTRRLEHGRKDTEALVFDNAGHGIGLAIPYLPVSTEFSSDGFTLESGGTRQADALARTASWPKLIALLQRVERGSD